MADIRVGAQVEPEQVSYTTLRETWKQADRLGADLIFTWDHFFPVYGDATGRHFEAWTVLAAMAEVTKRTMLGVLVTNTGYRNPHLLADMARTVDHASGGRVILGVGAGWYERDYREYGYRYGTISELLSEFERALAAIKDRFSKLNPGPVHGTIPIMIGAGGEKVALRIVAEHADIWNDIGDPQLMARKTRILDDWCARVGRNPAEIRRSVLMIEPELVGRADEYVEAGITDLLVAVRAPDHDLTPLERLLEWRDSGRSPR